MMHAAKTLLLAIDVQNDFCPAYTLVSGEKTADGALAVQNGDEVIAPLNALAAAFVAAGGRVAATQDWHPAEHVSFASSHNGKKPGDIIDFAAVKGQVLWMDHCVQGKWGAAFHDKLDLKPVSLIVRKGFRKELDSYSAFFENDRETPTGLAPWIRGLGIDTIVLGGLATDYCVFYSALDAKRLGFNTIVASDAVRGVGYPAGSVEKAIEEMQAAEIGFATSAELIKELR
ncbi:nicotinamidase [Spirochaetia bacterium]|nr:nicotinamidase [Spirochaetia bacterium]